MIYTDKIILLPVHNVLSVNKRLALFAKKHIQNILKQQFFEKISI